MELRKMDHQKGQCDESEKGDKEKIKVDDIYRQQKHSSDLTYYNAQVAFEVANYTESFKAVIQAGQTALKSAILINGGAAVALLAFIGSLWSSSPSIKVVESLSSSMQFFVFGVLSSAIATGIVYLAQYANMLKKSWTFRILNFISIILVIFSYICFVTGSYYGFQAFLKQVKPI
jgi:hypothetical protein